MALASQIFFPQYRAKNGQSVIGYFEFNDHSEDLILSW